MNKNLLLVGVGGQGTILVSKVLSQGLIDAGYDVKMSEIHGMAQRGGSVTTQIKFGEKVYSPCIGKGEADVMVAFEKLEAARWISNLKKGGILLVNDVEIHPLSVLIGKEKYPSGILQKLEDEVENIKIVDTYSVAKKLGEPRAQNIVMLGVLIKTLKLEEIDWERVLRDILPDKILEVNIKALKKGMLM